jgi:hypothetical protein
MLLNVRIQKNATCSAQCNQELVALSGFERAPCPPPNSPGPVRIDHTCSRGWKTQDLNGLIGSNDVPEEEANCKTVYEHNIALANQLSRVLNVRKKARMELEAVGGSSDFDATTGTLPFRSGL